uniref:EF-hand domain-containing protein n=1 Tax=Angiostrongylus cantonensis TaxID=6313 RepID=A0A0K0CW61_ANGCA
MASQASAFNLRSRDDLLAKYNDVDAFLLRKWERIFSMFFDRNSSQQMDWGDFYLVVRVIYGAESEQIKFAQNTLAALWEGLCSLADVNEDQLISIDEWVNLLKNADLKNEKKWFNEYKRFMFQLFDVSCDEVIDIEEYVDGMSVYGLNSPASREAFKKFSVNQKGASKSVITQEMWSKYFDELFYSTDRNALGNHLFGISDF